MTRTSPAFTHTASPSPASHSCPPSPCAQIHFVARKDEPARFTTCSSAPRIAPSNNTALSSSSTLESLEQGGGGGSQWQKQGYRPTPSPFRYHKPEDISLRLKERLSQMKCGVNQHTYWVCHGLRLSSPQTPQGRWFPGGKRDEMLCLARGPEVSLGREHTT